MKLDETDKRLISALQRNGQMPAHELAELMNLSTSQAGRRRQRLEAEGMIRGYAARVTPEKVGLMVQAFVQVQMQSHGVEGARSFATLVETQPEITDAWILTGEADYLLRIYCADLSALNRLIQDILLPHPAVNRVQSQLVMEQLKTDAPLPV